jgi:hypothetical protein
MVKLSKNGSFYRFEEMFNLKFNILYLAVLNE